MLRCSAVLINLCLVTANLKWVLEGNCSVSEDCVASPNYPEPYGNKDYCLISLPKPSLIEVTAFETEKGYFTCFVGNGHFEVGMSHLLFFVGNSKP